MSGKSLRLRRCGIQSDRGLVVLPLDHGVTYGPIQGLEQPERMIRMGIEEGTDAVVLHKGLISQVPHIPGRLPGIFMHLSASTQLGPNPQYKVLVGSVEEAIRRGADGVSVHVIVGDPNEPRMLEDLGRIGAECARWRMPLLVMIYPLFEAKRTLAGDSAVAHGARIAMELGADCVKIPLPLDIETLEEITGSLLVPVVVAGGGRSLDPLAFLRRIEKSVEAGARGVAVGRNVFQQEQPREVLRAIMDIVHGGSRAAAAWEKSSNRDSAQEGAEGCTHRTFAS